MRQCLAAEEQALACLGHDLTYAVCSPRAVPAPVRDARAVRRPRPARPGYEGLTVLWPGQAQGPAQDPHLGLDRSVSGPVTAGKPQETGHRG